MSSEGSTLPMADPLRAIGFMIVCMTLSMTLSMTLRQALADDTVMITEFSSTHVGQLVPNGWKTLDFPGIDKKTSYEVVWDKQYEAVIHARSKSGAGGLVRPVTLRAEEFATLSWFWKIDKTINGSVVGSKNGDDFPARMMVSFKNQEDQPSSINDNTLCYVWADSEPVGTVGKNPYHDHIMTIVVANGNGKAGEWLELSRNLVKDYISAFGSSPEWISAVTLMTDSDNTMTDTQAWYGPITLSRQKPDAH